MTTETLSDKITWCLSESGVRKVDIIEVEDVDLSKKFIKNIFGERLTK